MKKDGDFTYANTDDNNNNDINCNKIIYVYNNNGTTAELLPTNKYIYIYIITRSRGRVMDRFQQTDRIAVRCRYTSITARCVWPHIFETSIPAHKQRVGVKGVVTMTHKTYTQWLHVKKWCSTRFQTQQRTKRGQYNKKTRNRSSSTDVYSLIRPRKPTEEDTRKHAIPGDVKNSCPPQSHQITKTRRGE